MAKILHPLFKRQFQKYLGSSRSLYRQFHDYFLAVNSCYWQSDDDRKRVERTLVISSKELFERNSEIRAVFEAFPDLFLRIDDQGRILSSQSPKTNDFHWLPKGLIGKSIMQLFGEGAGREFVRAMEAVKESKTLVSIEFEQKVDGQTYHYESRFLPLMDQQYIITIRNITERKIVTKALRESEERYSLAVTGANDGMWDWDLQTNQIFFSERWKTMLGFANHELMDTPDEWLKRVHPDDIQRLRLKINAQLKNVEPHFELEYRIFNKDQQVCWVLTRGVAVRDQLGKITRMVGSQTDITKRKLAEDQLRHDALHDKLTSLPNRALFIDRLENLIERNKRNPQIYFAVLFIDLDRFKMINDSYGHTLGDQLLIKISKRLKACMRSGDTVARLGGDEFTILLEDIQHIQEATSFAERIQDELSHPFDLNGQMITVTASIGILMNSHEHQGAEDYLRDADNAMYSAKMRGKACHEVFDKSMHQVIMDRLNLEVDLRRALEKKEFIMYYQPVVSLMDGKIKRFETLIRWRHPQRGLLEPSEFITIAEETGLIVGLGQWILENVCQKYQLILNAGYSDVGIAVNFSTRQFQHQRLLDMIRTVMQNTKMDSRFIEIEITESMAMRDVNFTVNVLNQLKAMGFTIAIDDFGVGYSSLSSLKMLPLDCLKVDQSFIRDIAENIDNQAITQAIVAMAHTLGIRVVAEGVEKESQLRLLQKNGCDEAQGYLFSRPVPFHQALTQLKQDAFAVIRH